MSGKTSTGGSATMLQAGRRRRGQSKLADRYHYLFDRLWREHDSDTRDSWSLGITSCTHRAGVSTVAVNLAVAAAEAAMGPVLLVDANREHPTVHRLLRLRRSPGWWELLAGAVAEKDVLQPSRIANLSVVPAGTTRAVQVCGEKVAAVIGGLKRLFPVVIFDLPVAVPYGNCLQIAGKLNGILYVIEAERADGRAALRAKQALLKSGADIVGVVFNKWRDRRPGWFV